MIMVGVRPIGDDAYEACTLSTRRFGDVTMGPGSGSAISRRAARPRVPVEDPSGGLVDPVGPYEPRDEGEPGRPPAGPSR